MAFARIARLLLEANGAKPAAARPTGPEEIVWDVAAGSFISRPRPPRLTRWCEHHQMLETVDAEWDPTSQTFKDPVHGTCTEAAETGGNGRISAWSPAEEARQLAREIPKETRANPEK